MTATYLTGPQAVTAIARLSLLRLVRGKALWFALGIGLLPVLLAWAWAAHGTAELEAWDRLIVSFTMVMGIIAPILIASSLSDEIDDRTAAYLWSRAVPRGSVIVGKLLGLAPVVAVPLILGLTLSWLILGGPSTIGGPIYLRTIGAFVLGAIGASSISALIATLAPRFATPIAVGWMLVVDTTFAGFDVSIHSITVSYGTRALARGSSDPVGPISLLVLIALSLAWSLRRVKRIE